MKYGLVALVIAWIAFDVIRGALTGLAEARQEELSAMPLPEMLEVVAGSEERRIGSEWVDNALVLDIEASRRTIVSAHGRASSGEVGRHVNVAARVGVSETPVTLYGPTTANTWRCGSVVTP